MSFPRQASLRGIWIALFTILVCAVSSTTAEPRDSIGASLRARYEDWNWFSPGAVKVGNENNYSFETNLLKINADWKRKDHEAFVEIASPSFIGLPTDAVAAGTPGQLGLGGTYRFINGGQSASAFINQAWVNFKGFPGVGGSLRVGRFDFGEGAEALSGDPTLDWLKRERVSLRLIGPFGYSAIQRSFDGINLTEDWPGQQATFAVMRPRVGGFDLNGMEEVNHVNLVYAADTFKPSGAKKVDDGRLFFIHTDDDRLDLKTDNRAAAVKNLDRGRISIETFGGNYERKLGNVDAMAWGALQSGDWGSLHHDAWAYDAELGWQPSRAGWRPWFRIGTTGSSGDKNPKDSTHGTFYQILPTVRQYARFPFFNMMNLTDTYAMLILRPGKKTTVRADAHDLQLTEAADLWYSGSGPFQSDSFGYVGRAAGGFTKLADLYDLSLDHKFDARTSMTLYGARAVGGGVMASVYPGGQNAAYFYLEVNHRF